ncbi:MAG: GGDEF domain-containing protein, partial [Planctomycetes bacterium]|nr:GGDEF domain-containing protein [Planctomycetota bacterium]
VTASAPAPLAPSTPPFAPPPPTGPRSKGDLEKSIELAIRELAGYRRSLVTIDARLRAVGDSEHQPCMQLLTELKMVNSDYSDRSRTVIEGLRGRAFAALTMVRTAVDTALSRHAERMQTASDDLTRLEGLADEAERRRELTAGMAALLDSVHELRDRLSLSLLEIARQERRLGTIEPELLADELTDLPNRGKLEAQLDNWWQLDPERTRSLSVASLDLDNFRQLNAEHGASVCDAILRSIAEIVAEANAERRGNLAGLFAGQRFALLLGNTGARNATGTVERIRQAVQLATFRHGEQEIHATLSGSVVEAQADDTADTLFQRVEATLQEAKRYGRNRTFLHEGNYPTPVMPLNFSLEPREVTV